MLLVYLQRYFELFAIFKCIDHGFDQRIDLAEFTRAAKAMREWGVIVRNPTAEFKKIDRNGGGQLLFDEFSRWALQRGLELIDDEPENGVRGGIINPSPNHKYVHNLTVETKNHKLGLMIPPRTPLEEGEEEDLQRLVASHKMSADEAALAAKKLVERRERLSRVQAPTLANQLGGMPAYVEIARRLPRGRDECSRRERKAAAL